MATPVAAGGADIDVVVAVSSPSQVTLDHYVAYPVTIKNIGSNTLNTVYATLYSTSESGDEELPFGDDFTYVGAVPASCSQSGTPTCALGQMPSEDSRTVTFYFHVTGDAPRTEWVKAAVSTAEGTRDNSDGTANNIDYWESSPPIETEVVEFSQNFISGHGIVDLNTELEPTLDTGLGVTDTNPHGTSVTVPRNAEITITDLPPLGLPACPTGFASCFGWGSQLDVGTDIDGVDEIFEEGIVVTMVWDSSQLPSGMTAKKLRVVHLPEPGDLWAAQNVNPTCAYDEDSGLPTNMPCFLQPPSKWQGNDIKAVMLWDHNGIGRGW